MLFVAWLFGVQRVAPFFYSVFFSGVVSRHRDLQVSQYVGSVDSASLTHHRHFS